MWDNINNGYTDDNTPCFCPENMSSVITKLQSTTKRNCSGGMKTWKKLCSGSSNMQRVVAFDNVKIRSSLSEKKCLE